MCCESLERVLEWLVPAETFTKSKDKESDVRDARVVLSAFYIVLCGVFGYTLLRLVAFGRIEVVRTNYKVDLLEAPSIAICPFDEGESILGTTSRGLLQQGFTSNSSSVSVIKYGVSAPTDLQVPVQRCTFDRVCVCVDLTGVTLQDHNGEDTDKVGTMGGVSDRAVGFRERIKLLTTLKDPGPSKTLKFGLFDLQDPIPMWTYVDEGAFRLGQLELEVWHLTSWTPSGLLRIIRGDYTAFASQRHIWRYTSQGTQTSGHGKSVTALSYDMRDFFVDEVVSSETVFSGFTLLFLVFLLMVRSAVVTAFKDEMFPLWTEDEGPQTREVSWMVDGCMSYVCCCLRRKKASPDAATPLVSP